MTTPHQHASEALTRSQQEEIHDRHAHAAYGVLLDLMQRRSTRKRVVELSKQRLLGIGFDEYGDAMFRQTFPELLTETDEELADAVNRMVAALELGALEELSRA